MRTSLLMIVPLGVAFAAPVGAQESSPSAAAACDDDAFRAFDFWLGEWRVSDAAGREGGRSHISRISEGCALLEEWTNARGKTGTSLNMYDPGDGHWHQYWVGGDGTVLRLAGGLEGDTMSMTGVTATDSGPILERIRWAPQPDGRVEQRWDQSSDDGASWATLFTGYYERVAGAGSVDEAAGGPGPSACVNEQAHAFDFWAGTWDVESRRRDASGAWHETRNDWRAEEILGGCAFVDYTDGDFGTGHFRGMGTRYYDPGADRWYITWMSTEQPGAFETWEGGFEEGGTAQFLAEIETPRGTLLSRIRWWDIQEDSAEWEHAISRDDGESWTPTWRMTLTRAP